MLLIFRNSQIGSLRIFHIPATIHLTGIIPHIIIKKTHITHDKLAKNAWQANINYQEFMFEDVNFEKPLT